MADEVVTTPAPVVPAPVVATAVTPPAAVVPPAPASAADPAWLPDRIAQAKRSAEADLLKSLGFESPEAAKAAGHKHNLEGETHAKHAAWHPSED